MNKFIFDVDGTLTPSRGKIDPEFNKFFFNFACTYDVYLVTGSDYDKTVEQLGNSLCCMVKRVYNCSGNDVWQNGTNIYTNDWTLPEEAREFLNQKLSTSEFPLRTGLHIEDRPGMVNFSVVGRNATLGERKLYHTYDTQTLERHQIAKEFKLQFPLIEATVGGETGIDIFPIGSDKSQILSDFSDDDFIYFFGDMCKPGGNDFPIANAIREGEKMGVPYQVDSWKDTWRQLNAYITNGT